MVETCLNDFIRFIYTQYIILPRDGHDDDGYPINQVQCSCKGKKEKPEPNQNVYLLIYDVEG